MIKISAKVTGVLWHYAANEADDRANVEVIVDELRPCVGNITAVDTDVDTSVYLLILLICDELVYEMRSLDLTLSAAQDTTNDLITSGDVVAHFSPDGFIDELKYHFGSLEVMNSRFVGVPMAFRDDETDRS